MQIDGTLNKLTTVCKLQLFRLSYLCQYIVMLDFWAPNSTKINCMIDRSYLNHILILYNSRSHN